jgi:DNA-binding Lrp family transcriptional regulator
MMLFCLLGVDEIDLVLCSMLMSNSRTPYRALADKLGLSVNAIHKRIQSLIETDVIRGFTAKPSIRALGFLSVFIHGASNARSINEAMKKISTCENVYWICVGGGNHLYVGAYVRGLSKLNEVAATISDLGEIPEPVIGIVETGYNPETSPREELESLDWEIIYQLRNDSKRPIFEVADAIGISAKTARRRLDKLIHNQLIELSILWYPDASNDIISVYHVHTEPKIRLNPLDLYRDYSPRLIMAIEYQNIPGEYLLLAWSRTTNDMRELYLRIEDDSRFESVTANIIFLGEVYPTWRDKLLEEKGAPQSI